MRSEINHKKKKNINTNTGGKTAGYQATNGPLKKAKRKWEKKRERETDKTKT